MRGVYVMVQPDGGSENNVGRVGVYKCFERRRVAEQGDEDDDDPERSIAKKPQEETKKDRNMKGSDGEAARARKSRKGRVWKGGDRKPAVPKGKNNRIEWVVGAPL